MAVTENKGNLEWNENFRYISIQITIKIYHLGLQLNKPNEHHHDTGIETFTLYGITAYNKITLFISDVYELRLTSTSPAINLSNIQNVEHTTCGSGTRMTLSCSNDALKNSTRHQNIVMNEMTASAKVNNIA